MKHKLFTLLLAMIASVGTMFASDIQVNGIWYNFDSSTQTATVTYRGTYYYSYSNEYSGNISIPSTVTYEGQTYNVTSIGPNTFEECSSLVSVVIPNSVTSIGYSAFGACSGLTSVTIPNSVTSIGDYAFYLCSDLTSIEIPNSVTRIGTSAFNRCTGLTSMDIPNSVTSIGAYVFYLCSGLTSMSIGNSVTTISSHAFDECLALASVMIPTSVANIEEGAFRNCSALTTIDIPNSVTSIGESAFRSCTGLTSIAIPNSVTTIGNEAFAGCWVLSSIEIPNSLTSIGESAFSGCRVITSITNYATMPQVINASTFNDLNKYACTLYVPAESVEAYQTADVWKEFPHIQAIEGNTPEPCIIASGTCGAQGDNLTWTLTCDSVLTISGTGAMEDYEWDTGAAWYSNKESIKSVIIENGVTSIGVFAFKDCHVLLSVEIPNSVTSIGSQAFQGSGLSYVRIPSNVTDLGLGIFAGCSDLSSIDVDVNNPYYCSIDGVLFKKYNTILKQYPGGKQGAYAIPNGVTSIDIAAFYGCSGLTSVEIPNSVTSIGEWAFYSCSSLTSIDIPNSVTSIGRDAFWNCTGLTSVSISNSVTSIGEETFADCISLTSFTNYALQPQMVNSNVFVDVDKSACTLYVPAESIEAYKTADVWKEFGTILPIGGQPEVNDTLTIVEAIQIGMALDSMETSVETYTIEGYVINAGTINQSFKYQNWYMADDPNVTSSDFQAYRCYPIDGLDTTEVRNGSKVRMTGKLHKYYDRTKALYVVEMINIPATILSKPQIDTITVAEALAIGAELAENANTAKQYVIRGYVSSVTTPFSEQNGDQNFYIADDSLSTAGSTAAGGFYVYRGKPATGTAIKEGALVEITCAIKNYRNINIENHEYPVTITILQDGPECRIITGTCGDNLTWTFNNCDSVLTISGTGAMDDYTSYSATPWSSNRASIKFVIIEDGVTSIGRDAFWNCTGLTSVSISNSVTSIGEETFADCISLTSFTNYALQPQMVNSNVFVDVDKSACTLYVPAESVEAYQTADVWKEFPHIQAIEGNTPEPCIIASGTCGAKGDNLTWTLTCDSVLTISGTGAMADYSSEQIPQTPWNSYLSEIKSVVIEEGATNIGRWAFGNCTSLTSVEIPNSVTSIGNKAFCNCSGLTSVTMPNSVTSIGTCAFENCSGLTSVTIPNSVSIGEWAFYECTGLTSVTIPNSVTSIGNYAFENCSGLTSVTIPDSLTSIGWGAFENCTGLTSPVYNAHVFAFMPTSYSGAYTIPDGIESIAGVAFSDCSGLTSVTIPNSVTSIGWGAFRFCSGLTSVTIPNSVTSIGESAFMGCTALTSVTIPNSVTSIGYEAFYYCTGLTSVTIPNSVTSIGYSAFYNCTGLTSVTIPNSVTSIGESAFSFVANIVYSGSATGSPWGARSINGYVDGYLVYSDNTKTNLLACSSAATGDITIPNSVTSIGYMAFAGCTGLTSVTIPNSITSIGDWAFLGCSSLTSVTIPNSVTSIGWGAFRFCSGLTSVTIPNSVTSIGNYAFENCSGLTSVTIEAETPPTLDSYAFDNTNNSPIYVPCGTLDAYKSAWSDYADRIKYEVEYTIIGNVNDAKAGSVDYPTSACRDVVITAIPNYGYHFTQWSDGNTDNPRTIELTQDTTFTAEFAPDRVGTCGKDLALVWSYDPTNKVLTIGNAGSFTENMQFGAEAPNEMEELIIGNSVTAIGANAFAGIETLKKITIGESVKTIGEQAFYNCVNLETIFNYRPTPTNTYSNAFDGVDKFECVLYVLPSSIDMYKNAAVWRDFYYTYAIGAEETTVTTNDVTVEPQDNAATLTWPTSNNAATYTIQITKDGVVFCTLIFNSNGQLTGIAFAPSRDGQAHAPAALMTANGLQFTVTGLDSGTQYGYSVTAKDANDQTVATYSGSFTTTSEGTATAIDNTSFPSGEGRGEARKLLRDGQIFILRGEKVYTLTGAEVK